MHYPLFCGSSWHAASTSHTRAVTVTVTVTGGGGGPGPGYVTGVTVLPGLPAETEPESGKPLRIMAVTGTPSLSHSLAVAAAIRRSRFGPSDTGGGR